MRWRFFAGKGGVGKTTLAAASALAAAERGAKVLAISTDPAHSLGDALGTKLRAGPRAVPVRRGKLFAAELDADAALEKWIGARRSRLETIAERGTYLERSDVAPFLDLSFPGVDELVALVELNRLAKAGRYDAVFVDTAPTGHTLRMLEMPATLRQIAVVLADMQAKHRVMAETLARRYTPDACDALIEEIDREGAALQAMLRDASVSELTWIMLPEALSLEESRDGVTALEKDGIGVTRLVVNRLTRRGRGPCAFCDARRAAESAVLREAAAWAGERAAIVLEEEEVEPRGLPALRRLGGKLAEGSSLGRRAREKVKAPRAPGAKRKTPVAPPLALPPGLRLLLFGGKGGVGKTTSAAAAALALAATEPGRRVLLLSTDPAHSLGDALGLTLGDDVRAIAGAPANLRARELDAAAAFAARRETYRQAVDEFFDSLRRGSRFDASHDRAVIRDLIDLAPPGLDELFAVLSVTDALFPAPPGKPSFDLVVLDTAPTGHTLRLLQMPAMAIEWIKSLLQILLKYRDFIAPGKIAADLVEASRQLKALQAALTDPERTSFVAVTRAAALPREETLRLAGRLRKLRVPLGGVLVNAVREPGCAICRRVAREQADEIRALAKGLPKGCAILLAPAVAPPPRGVETLLHWPARWTSRRP